jgi:hypothetical protein
MGVNLGYHIGLFIWLLICGSFNSIISGSDYIALNNRITFYISWNVKLTMKMLQAAKCNDCFERSSEVP